MLNIVFLIEVFIMAGFRFHNVCQMPSDVVPNNDVAL